MSNLTSGLLFVHRFAIETSTGCFFSLRPPATLTLEEMMNTLKNKDIMVNKGNCAPLKKSIETKNRPDQKRLSPRQLKILFSYLGEP